MATTQTSLIVRWLRLRLRPSSRLCRRPVATQAPPHPLSKDTPDVKALLALNPGVSKQARSVPTYETKKNKHNWKRNADKCGSCASNFSNDFRDIKRTTLSERGALREALSIVISVRRPQGVSKCYGIGPPLLDRFASAQQQRGKR
ncbi:hypothetical protein ANCCEY_02159 [Ancylostoma ceylanicum]|uniref:Uncharacterized protein n=1 Tax=Ancylostoma ceylanicum TaxID=53326 RepID=A0A0D6M3Q4_9BILA|nr:hypothetical protein ANCCEY_02159 [Ancylostoma ceylanicum]